MWRCGSLTCTWCALLRRVESVVVACLCCGCESEQSPLTWHVPDSGGPPQDQPCLSDIEPVEPINPQPQVDRPGLMFGGTAGCVDGLWSLQVMVNTVQGWGQGGTDDSLDGVTFRAWDLLGGSVGLELPGELTESWAVPDHGRREVWTATTPATPSCEESRHVAFTVAGTQGGRELRPAGTIDGSSPIWVDAVALGEGRWEAFLSADGAEEVWLWATFLDGEAYGPFRATRREEAFFGGEWSWKIDQETEDLLDIEEGVLAAMACSAGVPLGTTTWHTWLYR